MNLDILPIEISEQRNEEGITGFLRKKCDSPCAKKKFQYFDLPNLKLIFK